MCHFWLLHCSEYLAVAECCVPEARNPTVVDAFLHFTWLWLWGGMSLCGSVLSLWVGLASLGSTGEWKALGAAQMCACEQLSLQQRGLCASSSAAPRSSHGKLCFLTEHTSGAAVFASAPRASSCVSPPLQTLLPPRSTVGKR